MLGFRRGPEIAASLCGIIGVFALLPGPEACLAAAWWVLVISVIKSDIADYLISDWATAGIAGLGLLHAALSAPGATQAALVAAVESGLLAFAMFFAIARLYRALAKREGLGFGDVKLAGASALWLDIGSFAMCLQLATLTALILVLWRSNSGRNRLAVLPFGAFLAPSAWLVHVATSAWPDVWPGLLTAVSP